MRAYAGAASGGPRESLEAPLCATNRGVLPKPNNQPPPCPFFPPKTILKTGWGSIWGKTAPSITNWFILYLSTFFCTSFHFSSHSFILFPFFAFLLFCGPPVLSPLPIMLYFVAWAFHQRWSSIAHSSSETIYRNFKREKKFKFPFCYFFCSPKNTEFPRLPGSNWFGFFDSQHYKKIRLIFQYIFGSR